MSATAVSTPPAPLRALDARRRALERYLATRVLPAAPEAERSLEAAMAWALLGPGKRLRPLLVLASCEAVGGEWRDALPAAAAVELVHAFSLVHDDLPAMDDDDYRRGRLTTHKKYGEALGILAGDALVALAFEQVTALGDRGVPARRIVEITRRLAEASGWEMLIGGQALDLAAEGREVAEPDVLEIHRRKTAALISAAMEIGGIVGGAGPDRRARLRFAGRDLGLAFQITDDLLNLDSTLEALGKRPGTDAERGKATYPRAVGSEQARERAKVLIRRTLSRVRSLGPRAALLERLVVEIGGRRS